MRWDSVSACVRPSMRGRVFMKACTVMFIVLNVHVGGLLSTFFLNFRKFKFGPFGVHFLGQNLPKFDFFTKLKGNFLW